MSGKTKIESSWRVEKKARQFVNDLYGTLQPVRGHWESQNESLRLKSQLCPF
jgi:hypothetical protein